MHSSEISPPRTIIPTRCNYCQVDLTMYDHADNCPLPRKNMLMKGQQLTTAQLVAEIATNEYIPELLLRHAMQLLTAPPITAKAAASSKNINRADSITVGTPGGAGTSNSKEELAGALKYDLNKPQMQLLDSIAMEQLAAVLTFGASKYSANNWRKGISSSRLLAAALRHIFAYLRGQVLDSESNLPHLAHAMCCLMFAINLAVTKPELTDHITKEGSN